MELVVRLSARAAPIVPAFEKTLARLEAVKNDPANRPLVDRNEDAPVPPVNAATLVEAVKNDPARSPLVDRKLEAPVPPVKAATDVDAVKNEPASRPFVDKKLEAPVPALLMTLFEPDAVRIDPARVAMASTIGICKNVKLEVALATLDVVDDARLTPQKTLAALLLVNVVMPVIPDAASSPEDDMTLAAVGAALKAVIAAEPLAVKAEAAESAVEVPLTPTSTLATVGAALKAVIAAEPDAVCAEAAVKAVEVPLTPTRTLATVGAALKAVMAAEPEAVCAEAAVRAGFTPLAVAKTGALVGAALHAVMLVELVAKVLAALRVAEVMPVTAPIDDEPNPL